jgi:hypothetical protein
MAFPSLIELRHHLVQKTSWSNLSLVGSKINCLLDNREWHEGVVIQYHKSGKHHVEFRAMAEKRWILMSKTAFFIIDRNQNQAVEQKENEENTDKGSGDDPVDTEHLEDISLEFAFAQSALFKVYGGVIQETGHRTRGHLSLTDHDRYSPPLQSTRQISINLGRQQNQ